MPKITKSKSQIISYFEYTVNEIRYFPVYVRVQKEYEGATRLFKIANPKS